MMSNLTPVNSKKLREVRFFEKVREMRPELWPRSEREDFSSESPDIFVDLGVDSYGVEITEIVHQQARVGESDRNKVCRLASRIAQIGLGIKVDVLFHSNIALESPATRQVVATLLAQLVRGFADHHGNARWQERVDCWGSPLGDYASQVFMHFIPMREHPVWQAAEAWSPKFLFSDRIAEVIARKEPKLAAYRKKALKVFLLIVAEGFRGSTAIQIRDEALSCEYGTDFSGIVLLDYGNNSSHILQTRQLA
jgi:hypothetical protein